MKRSGAFFLFPQPFIDRNSHRIGKIQTAVELSRHGDGVKVFFVFFMQFIRKPAAFTSENKVCSFFHGTVPESLFPFCGEKVDGGIAFCFQEFFPGSVSGIGDVLPVIHSGAFDMFVIQQEAQRFDEVQCTIRAYADPADIACILGDLRVMKHNMEIRMVDIAFSVNFILFV